MKRFLMLDYDGTLTPLRKHPKLARLSPNRKSFLRQLASRSGTKLAIISGRKLSSVKRMVGLRNIIYIGNHGFEIEAGGRRWIHPAAKGFMSLLKKAKRTLKNKLPYQGMFVEDKGLTVSVHYRALTKKVFPAFNKLFSRVVKPWLGRIKITHGKKVFEIRPPVDWNKGKAVKWVINALKLKDYQPIYIGDDVTDEDAFRALKSKGITLHVGGGKTSAKMRVKNVKGVYRYLRGLIKNESKNTV